MARQAAADAADPPGGDVPTKSTHRSRSLGPTRVAPSSPSSVEKSLPNGDLYRGGFSGHAPHGHGKYLWSDGCMYEGSWRRGKAAGHGKFSWPSGATYEGSFRQGRMDGLGTFTGPAGDSYRGAWLADRKHGTGSKSYANGDCYTGQWRRNLQHGHGRYLWRNGNQYVGEWRDGVIAGRGVLIWANGNRYDGTWDRGVPKGSGVFTWPDGSCYVGSWNRDLKSRALNGTFYPAVKKSDSSNLPRICIWESDLAGDITCDIVQTLEVHKESSSFSSTVSSAKAPCCFSSTEAKKPGQPISKGHKNYDLMLNLQLGIRYSVGKAASAEMRELRPGDFDPREKFWTRFPAEGSKVTPPHMSVEFRWKDYCPMVFRHLRQLFAVDPADYMVAVCGSDALREMSSPGKSGSFFYLTQDDRFMIKTVKKSEAKVLIRMLPSYYQHICKYKNSLVTKFFGVHCIKPVGGPKVRFIVMGNLFCSEYRIHRRFDLKGSSHGRSTDMTEGEIDETTTLKDLDLNFVFRLKKSWFNELIEQIDRDCEFLEAERIMDYSLLVGLHFCDDDSASKISLSRSESCPKFVGKPEPFLGGEDTTEFRMLEFGLQEMDEIIDSRKPLIRLGANMPARAEHVWRESDSGPLLPPPSAGEVYDVILHFGVIDILQDYDISKKLEHAYKSLQADPSSISAVDPKLYSRRFRDFIGKIFLDNY